MKDMIKTYASSFGFEGGEKSKAVSSFPSSPKKSPNPRSLSKTPQPISPVQE